MQAKKRTLRALGTILFFTGNLVGVVTFVLMNWANLEARFFFGTTYPVDKKLSTLRCPLVMTTAHPDQVTISLTNDTDQDLSVQIRVEISSHNLARVQGAKYQLPAGKTTELSWGVSADDTSFGHLVMTRIYVFRSYTLPSRLNTCGTVIFDLPRVNGIDIFILDMVVILISLVAGWALWLAGSHPLQTEEMSTVNAMILFTILVVVGLICGITGLWMGGVACAAVFLLMTAVVAGIKFQRD